MTDYVVYGKIIIDDVELLDGTLVRSLLGGGGPQAAFGARLWSKSVGFLSRSGTDMAKEHITTLKKLDFDLKGWTQFDDLPTPLGVMRYDDQQYLDTPVEGVMKTSREDWLALLSRELSLPKPYQKPRIIHLITEFHNEPMVHTALELKQNGALFSLEPLIDFRNWENRSGMEELTAHADIVTPDWPSASGIAGADKPVDVLKYWSKLGPSLVAIRDGERGSYVWDSTHDEMWHIPAVPVDVVDPTGAGNCYGGGLMVGWDETGNARLAGAYGAVSAYFLVGRYGFPEMSRKVQNEAQSLLEQADASAKKL